MKRKLILALLVVCLASFVLALTACHEHTYATNWSSDATNHWHQANCEHTEELADLAPHTFGEWQIITEPTCLNDGASERFCTVCNYRETGTMPALGHALIDHQGQVPTCEDIGWEGYATCSRCDYSTYVQISANGHSYGNLIPQVDATCTEAGKIAYYECSVCHKYFNEEKIEYLIDALVIPATGHNYGELIPQADATCTQTGKKAYYECSVCHKLFDDKKVGTTADDLVIQATGHSYGELIAKAEPTCTETGKKAYYECSVCHKLFDENKQSTVAESLVISATGHTEVVDEAVAPTCTATGLTEGKHCSVCDEILLAQQTVDAREHELLYHDAQPATFITIGWEAYYTCSRCDYTTYEELATRIVSYYDYGFETLGKHTNGTNIQMLYDDMRMACFSFYYDRIDLESNYIDFYSYDKYGVTVDEALLVWKVFYSSNPLFYWLSNSFTTEEDGFKLYIQQEYCTYQAREYINIDIEEMANEFLEISKGVDDSKKLYSMIYDFTIKKIAYAYEDDGVTPETDLFAHSIVGASTYKKGVCECYVKTYKFLCDLVGLKCISVPVIDAASENHIIILFYADNEWRAADPTYDDNGYRTEYKFYGMSKSEIQSLYSIVDDNALTLYLYDLPDIAMQGYYHNGLTWIEYASTEFSGGNGTKENPYQIATANDLALLSKITFTKKSDYSKEYYILTNDIDLKDYEWMPIGPGGSIGVFVEGYNRFCGNFNGNGHVIKNLHIDSDLGITYYGLFGYTYQAEIYDLFLENEQIFIASNGIAKSAGDLNNYYIIGGVVGSAYFSVVNNCTVDTTIKIKATNCVQTMIGCAFGEINYSSVNRVFAKGTISHTGNGAIWLGGFVGHICNELVIRECGFIGEIYGFSNDWHSAEMDQMGYSYVFYVGGFVGSGGRANSSITLEDCYAKANIRVETSGTVEVGGFMGIKEIVYNSQIYKNLICDSSIHIISKDTCITNNYFISNNCIPWCDYKWLGEEFDAQAEFENCLYYANNYIVMQQDYKYNEISIIEFNKVLEIDGLHAEELFFTQLGLDQVIWSISKDGKIILEGLLTLIGE